MKKLVFLLAAVALFTSCGAYKRLAYLQDMDPNVTYEVGQKPEARIGRGDRLAISVLSSQPLLAAPFNLSLEKISAKDTSAYSKSSAISVPEYVVDSKGRINFPVIGPVYVEGLTLNELTAVLADEIRKTNYLRDPVVNVEFANFNIIVLGEIGGGVVNVPTGSMNIFELLAKNGDLTQDAQRDRLWVIRTEGGTRKIFTLNLKSKSVYDSPAFYLQQNDMVYSAPRDSKMDTKTQNVLTWITTPLALISTIFSGLALLRAYTK